MAVSRAVLRQIASMLTNPAYAAHAYRALPMSMTRRNPSPSQYHDADCLGPGDSSRQPDQVTPHSAIIQAAAP